MSSDGLPLPMTLAGPQPTPPAVLRALLVALVAETNPGYTDNLPGSLIEDIASTDVGTLTLCDQARVEAVNSLTPLGANPFLLTQLGAIYGVTLGKGSNTSVFVVFTGTPGYQIAKGFTVSDGLYSYVVQDGGGINDDGVTDPLYAIATQSGSWAVPPGTVTQLRTSVPGSVTLSVINPQSGIPSQAAQTEEDYRTQVLQAGLAVAQGATRFLKTLLGRISGVQQRLISVRQEGDSYEIIVGGGDPYLIGTAIFQSIFFLPGLTGSEIGITAITKATFAKITTDLFHGVHVGQADVMISGATGMTAINGGPYTVHSIVSNNEFTINVDSTGFATYTGGGVVEPNPRNVSVTIADYPDTYDIPFVIPPQMNVEIGVTWDTTATNFVSATAVAQLASQPIVDYINSIPVGLYINVLTLDQVFRDAVAPILPPELVTRLVFSVSINGFSASPDVGTQIIVGDPESFFFTDLASVAVAQG